MTDKKTPTGSLVEHAAGRSISADEMIADSGKEFSTMAAQFALQGHRLVRADNGSMFAIRWNQAKHLPDAGAAPRYSKLIGSAQ